MSNDYFSLLNRIQILRALLTVRQAQSINYSIPISKKPWEQLYKFCTKSMLLAQFDFGFFLILWSRRINYRHCSKRSYLLIRQKKKIENISTEVLVLYSTFNDASNSGYGLCWLDCPKKRIYLHKKIENFISSHFLFQ